VTVCDLAQYLMTASCGLCDSWAYCSVTLLTKLQRKLSWWEVTGSLHIWELLLKSVPYYTTLLTCALHLHLQTAESNKLIEVPSVINLRAALTMHRRETDYNSAHPWVIRCALSSRSGAYWHLLGSLRCMQCFGVQPSDRCSPWDW